jgi:thiosulfate/3-mercaptopyruvate sulfurtransferase
MRRMFHTYTISTEELARHLSDTAWLVIDSSFILAKPEQSEQNYLQAHIPGAIYAHLDRDLSSPVISGMTGRHPLPSAQEAAHRIGQMGVANGLQVVAYDEAGGALAAARLWWMLRWLGFDSAAVLDGGLVKWRREDRLLRSGRETRLPAEFAVHPRPELVVTVEQVELIRQDPAYRLIDVRTPERYRGEAEPIDSVAGHIPGALNLPYTSNLAEDKTFRSTSELRALYEPLLAGVPSENVVFYCGSGVTSVHSILALLLAGLGEARLYAGSWSEWIAPGKRPVATGANPF